EPLHPVLPLVLLVLEDFAVRDDLDEPGPEDTVRHPQGPNVVLRLDVLQDRRIDGPLLDDRAALGFPELDLLRARVVRVGLPAAGPDLGDLTGAAGYGVLVAGHAARRVVDRPESTLLLLVRVGEDDLLLLEGLPVLVEGLLVLDEAVGLVVKPGRCFGRAACPAV